MGEAGRLRQTPAYRFAIIGAGLAGVSLARAFARNGVRGRVAIIDSKARFTDDRTWSFWDVDASADAALAAGSWFRCQLTDRSGTYAQAAAVPYVALKGAQFYASALMEIESLEHDVYLGERVVGVDARSSGCTVRTNARRIEAEYVFDARGLTAAMIGSVDIVQRFAGCRIETEHDTFDDGVATLMDVQADTHDGFHFFYLLPFSAREALVENTYFARRPIGRARLEDELSRYVARRFGGARPVVRYREAGAIPMSSRLSLPRPQLRIVPIGLRGGCARPGSGYTFHRVQRQVDRIARAFAQPASSLDGRDFAMDAPLFDELLIAAARFAPTVLPRAFRRLFATIDGDVLARFMMDCAGPVDTASVLLATGIGVCESLRAPARRWKAATCA
jgi:lycopene beta-cyclase